MVPESTVLVLLVDLRVIVEVLVSKRGEVTDGGETQK